MALSAKQVQDAIEKGRDALRQQHLDQSEPNDPHTEKQMGPGLTSSATEVDRALDPKAKAIEVKDGVAREVK